MEEDNKGSRWTSGRGHVQSYTDTVEFNSTGLDLCYKNQSSFVSYRPDNVRGTFYNFQIKTSNSNIM